MKTEKNAEVIASHDLLADAIGRAMAKHLWRPVWMFLGIMAAIIAFRSLTDWGKDSTDGEKGRSGMRLHIDAETGVEYLSAPGGGIIVREK